LKGSELRPLWRSVTLRAGFGRGSSLSKTDIEQLYRAMIVAEVRLRLLISS
jgi:hypothetical protein